MTTRRDFLKSSAVVAGGFLPYASRAPTALNNGGTLTVALFADPRTLDPHLTGNLQGRATTQCRAASPAWCVLGAEESNRDSQHLTAITVSSHVETSVTRVPLLA